MNQNRVAAILRGQTAVARKVYECVPIEEWWDLHAVLNEVLRLKYSIQPRVLSGCLSTLCDAGLIRCDQNRFQRVRVSEKVYEIPTLSDFADTSLKVKKETKEKIMAIDRLTVVIDKAKKLSADFQAFAGELETLAIELDDEMSANVKAAEKLTQLQTLLKGLG